LRKFIILSCLSFSLIVLTACGSSEEITEYIDVSFSGVDTMGEASYSLNDEELIEDVFDINLEDEFPDEETAEEIDTMLDAYKIKLENDEELSNGDTVKLTANVNEEKTDKIKGGEKEVTVEGLEEPKTLTSKDVEENLVLNFNGVSGRGKAQIDTTFDEGFLNDIVYNIENDGTLKNGDKAKLDLDDDFVETLNNNGYILEEDFSPTFEVKGLESVAEKADDIKNLKDVKRYLKEELNDKYKDTDYSIGPNKKYEIKEEALMYRQFAEEEDGESSSEMFGSGTNDLEEGHGSLIGIYSIEQYNVSDDEEELEEEFTAMYGFSGIILDDDSKANISKLETVSEEKDDSYSLDSVIQLYEGEGYEKVK